MKPEKNCGDTFRFCEKENWTKEYDFEKNLRGLMGEYDMTLDDIKDIFECAPGRTTRGSLEEAKKTSSTIYRKSRVLHPAKKKSGSNWAPLVRDTEYRAGKGLLVHQHTLFDLCPELLPLDGAQGERLFRDFIRHINYSYLVFDWAQHLKLYRWLESSSYAEFLESKHLEAVMAAAVSLWCEKDRSKCRGLALMHRNSSMMIMGKKSAGNPGHLGLEVFSSEFPLSSSSDFVYCYVTDHGHPIPRNFKALN